MPSVTQNRGEITEQRGRTDGSAADSFRKMMRHKRRRRRRESEGGLLLPPSAVVSCLSLLRHISLEERCFFPWGLFKRFFASAMRRDATEPDGAERNGNICTQGLDLTVDLFQIYHSKILGEFETSDRMSERNVTTEAL